MMGMKSQAKITAMIRPYHGSPESAPYVVPNPMARVAMKTAKYHQLDISGYTCIECLIKWGQNDNM